MELDKWLKNYLNEEGKLLSFPSKRKLKIAAMFYITAKIDDRVKYTEKEINAIIDGMCCFRDAALLRREMYNYRFINRTLDGKIYWKEEVQPLPEEYEL
ncbi:MAG: DUF2087 domain-containing protein [Mobilitalea sp.]